MSGLDRDRAQLKLGMLVYGPLLLLLFACWMSGYFLLWAVGDFNSMAPAQVVMSGLDRDRAQLKSGMLVYGPLLLLLPAEELAVITLHIAIKDLMSGKLWMTHK